jgi:hypothetical protein
MVLPTRIQLTGLALMALTAIFDGQGGAAATRPGAVTAPHPTLTNISLEWAVEGDDDLDGVVTVQYRARGDRAWREGMPLRRVPAGESRGTTPIFRWSNKHSGSVFDLTPGTDYEVRLSLEDPDGGNDVRALMVRTRPVPAPAPGAPERRVTPESLATVVARPGDVIVLAAGPYGAFTATADGEPGRPIVYRSPDGGALFESVSLQDRRYVHLEGVRIRNDQGTAVNLRGCVGCVVRGTTIRAMFGIRASGPPGCTDCYVADNVVEGLTPWVNEAMGANGKNIGEGIQLTGPGNVVEFNRVSGFRDAISTMEDRSVHEQYSIDILNNDISVGADDAIEADFCFHNCRIMRNRITNSFVGLSSQPGLGGPTFFIRNVMYNLTYVPFKLHRGSMGDVFLHNTTVKGGDGMACFSGAPFDFAYFRNNLSIGGPPGAARYGGYSGGTGLAANIRAHGPHASFDYDAVGTWQTPFVARIGQAAFLDVEPHGLRVDMRVFDGVEFPTPAIPEREPPDLRPRAGSAIVDAGLRIPNINDGAAGKAPDIGAYEAGQAMPQYGPRRQ